MTTKQLITETFNSKEGYLAWRAAWRAVYAQISADIRLFKMLHKDGCRNKIDKGALMRPWTPEEQKRLDARPAAILRLQQCYRDHACGQSALASLLLVRRAWSKEEAQRQYMSTRVDTVLSV